ncbi:hypothetical protein VM98_34855, partial [Streptomyces rubellomurinus subsp. indigoferus]
LERGTGLLVAWLAVLRAGGPLLPLDPASPARRLAALVQDCGARVAAPQGPGLPGVDHLPVDDAADSARGADKDERTARHAVVGDVQVRCARWPGHLAFTDGWRAAYGPAGREDCRDWVER